MSLVLGIDTSTDVRVGLARDGDVLARRHVADTRQHVEQLIPLVRDAMHECGVRFAELDLICVGLGPGPFTGLRVGIVAAQTLSSVSGVPLHGVCSLDVLAAAVTCAGEFVVATDARRKELYWARYEADGARRPQRLDGPHVSAPENLPELPVLGPGVAAYADRLRHRFRPGNPGSSDPGSSDPGSSDPDSCLADAISCQADAVDAGLMAALGTDLPSAGTQPLYLRRPDAAEPTRRKSALPRPVTRRPRTGTSPRKRP